MKFYATGIDENSKLFSVSVGSVGLLDCSNFSDTYMFCTGGGVMKVKKYKHSETIQLSVFNFEADKNADVINVWAEDADGNVVLDANVEDWDFRVPQQPINYEYSQKMYP